jgi:dienelactone hydrolase
MLAALGYVALAVDMYGNGKQAQHPDDAGKFAAEATSNIATMTARFNAALATLRQNEHVDPNRIAAIGYCFGGGVVLNMARSGADLKAVASFHGSLATDHPAEKGGVKGKILVCTGADDKFIGKEAVDGFKKEMKAAGADCKVISYPGATHSFTNPDADSLAKKFNMPIAYNEKADRASWEEMKKLFKKALGR